MKCKEGLGVGISRSSVVHISRARRPRNGTEPKIEPPMDVPQMRTELGEHKRAVMVDAHIGALIEAGDPGGWVLRKVNFVLQNADTYFTDPDALEHLIRFMVERVRDYGAHEGVPLLIIAHRSFGHLGQVRDSLNEAISRLGIEDFRDG
ncbi:MAG: hypothetical protein ABII71_02310 [Candidatus Micrarchaeota archaeon]